jgi:hypothetical protein
VTTESGGRRLLPRRRPGAFVYVTQPAGMPLPPVEVVASVLEDEGRTLVLHREDADGLGLPYGFVRAWIDLGLTSALDAVGLTATFSSALAAAGISCNVLAGFHHDHVLVPIAEADRALAVLGACSRRAADDVTVRG